jgi:ACT domain-containing protein
MIKRAKGNLMEASKLQGALVEQFSININDIESKSQMTQVYSKMSRYRVKECVKFLNGVSKNKELMASDHSAKI